MILRQQRESQERKNGKTCGKNRRQADIYLPTGRKWITKLNKHKFDTRKGESVITQMRTGYAKLNEYLNKSNITESNMCQCGEIESVKHYLIECENYENKENS